MEEFAGLERYADLLEKIDAWEYAQARDLGDWLIEKFDPKSVIDIGCASGLYLLPFLMNGAQVLGTDGAPTAGQKLNQKNFIRHDLRYPWHLSKYDLCICLETAEHIEPGFADNFVQTVATSSDLIVFSAAAPGQGGEGHFNCQSQGYWLEKFAQYGFSRHAMDGDFRKMVIANPDEHFHFWLINNGMLLGKA